MIPALKKAPHDGHLNSPIVTAFLPFGANCHVFVGEVTSLPHFGHLAMNITNNNIIILSFKNFMVGVEVKIFAKN